MAGVQPEQAPPWDSGNSDPGQASVIRGRPRTGGGVDVEVGDERSSRRRRCDSSDANLLMGGSSPPQVATDNRPTTRTTVRHARTASMAYIPRPRGATGRAARERET
jgi:hypothetical protein